MKVNKKAIEFYSTQSITQEDKDLVVETVGSSFLSRGPRILEFEAALGVHIKNKHVITVNSATSALQIAYQILDIKPDCLVWTSPITFVATANAAKLIGARVDFVDIDPASLNISPKSLEVKLKKAKRLRDLPDLVSVVHFGGNPCDMERIDQLSKIYNFKVVEDASHALGAVYKNHKIGENVHSMASVFSFHPVKMITTGEGGALSVKSKNLIKKASSIRSHGIEERRFSENDKRPEWYYEQTELGYNFRMSEIQAALGLSQLTRLEDFVLKRNDLASNYIKLLKGLPLKFQEVLPECKSSYHLFTVEITDKSFSRDRLYSYLKKNRIGSQVHYIPVHFHPYYKKEGFSQGMFENAENYFQRCLSLPLHQGLNDQDLIFISAKLKEFFK